MRGLPCCGLMKSTLLAVVLCGAHASATAGNWLVCDFTVKVIDENREELTAVVVNASKRNPGLCSSLEQELSFRPETPAYQGPLPREKWPKVNHLAHLRYRALRGVCKGDGRDYPCTIRHYSIMD